MGFQNAAEVAQTFLEILWSDTPPDDRALAAALDRLLSASHDIVEPSWRKVSSRPPKRHVLAAFQEWSRVYESLRARFPEYGHYAVASPLSTGAGAYMTGDAIDDLADITKDLREVVQRQECFGLDEAAWHFRSAYEAHWGAHARELALYLHARITRTPR